MQDDGRTAAESLNKIIALLSELPDDERKRVISAVATFFGGDLTLDRPVRAVERGRRPDFSEDYSPSPKDFVLEKQPKTDVERIACLAYYLSHFRDTPHFKTLDLAKLNTEAAQPKFSNAAYAAKNALNLGYLASSTKGQRQLSAAGEQFVRALPDRDAAKSAMAAARPRRFGFRKRVGKTEDDEL